MTEADGNAPHLTDTEIEAYWRGGLSESDEDRVEEHFVACADCRARVAALETLIESLRGESLTAARAIMRLRAWQLAAAVFAALAVGVAWLWGPLAAPGDGRPVAAAIRSAGGPLGVVIVSLVPPARGDSGEAVVTLASGTSLVAFELDVREAGASAGRFDLSLTTSADRVVLRLSEVAPTERGLLRVPVDASLLQGGRYLFTATTRQATVAIPFLIRPAGSR